MATDIKKQIDEVLSLIRIDHESQDLVSHYYRHIKNIMKKLRKQNVAIQKTVLGVGDLYSDTLKQSIKNA